ncbi:MAG: polyphosphate polymerase domain-containing protein [Chloroflexi bacterium]|nr:polyphosphate polymerase domain-containing protein [Chloroflexota bacterium]
MNDDLRYEQKMVFDALRLGEARSWVYAHPDSFRVANPPRQVNNIYFDTLDRQIMLDHINGTANRSKFRFRWYGESWQTNGGQIEVKKKIGQLGHKTIQPISISMDITRLSWREIVNSLKTDLSREYASLLESLYPTIINQYRREYYVSMDGIIRLTLDYDMRAFDQSFGFSPNTRFTKPLRNHVIIEMKSPKSSHQRLANCIAEFPLRCTPNSKYLNGVENAMG